MNKDITLFKRYKDMINLMWEDGQRRYTASELNRFVGDYENSTSWKSWNNNPYYTTRTYQTLLRDLGCLTKIKRGLWQINKPIPHWFSSLHLQGLRSSSYADQLEASSYVWKMLPPEHKVNPFRVYETPFDGDPVDDWVIESIKSGLGNQSPKKPEGFEGTLTIEEPSTDVLFVTNSCRLSIGKMHFKINVQWTVWQNPDNTIGTTICDVDYLDANGKMMYEDVFTNFVNYIKIETGNDNILNALEAYATDILSKEVETLAVSKFNVKQTKNNQYDAFLEDIGTIVEECINDTTDEEFCRMEWGELFDLSLSYDNKIEIEESNRLLSEINIIMQNLKDTIVERIESKLLNSK